MTIVNCPKCEEQVLIPGSASPQATVQCPLCTEQFELDEVLERIPPALVVVSDPGAAAVAAHASDGQGYAPLGAAAETRAFDVAPASANGDGEEAEFRLADEQPKSGRSGIQIESTAATASSISARRSARPQRKQKSAVAEVVKIVGGGVLGLTIGQLILWWLPGDWKRDPFTLGPMISRNVPWVGDLIVPAKFRGASVVQQDTAPDADSAPSEFGQFGTPAASGRFAPSGGAANGELPSVEFSDSAFGQDDASQANGDGGSGKATGSRRNQKRRPGSTPSGGAFGEPTSEGDGADGSPLTGGIFGSDPATTPNAGIGSFDDSAPGDPSEIGPTVPMIDLEAFGGSPTIPAPDGADTGDSGSVDDLVVPPPSLGAFPAPDTASETGAAAPAPEPPTTAGGESPRADEPVGLRDTPTVSADALATSLQTAVKANQSMDAPDSEVPDRAAARRDFYLSLTNLGESVTLIDETDDASMAHTDQVGMLLSQIVSDPNKLALIDTIAPRWLGINRPNNGVALLGTVESTAAQGPYFATRVKLAGGESVTVLSTSDPSAHARPQARLLVLGTIVENPNERLQGYSGGEAKVILDGYHAAVE